MRILIYGIGGDFNERPVGIAYDPATGLSLLRLLRLTRASGCSLHGHGLDPMYDTSGEHRCLSKISSPRNNPSRSGCLAVAKSDSSQFTA